MNERGGDANGRGAVAEKTSEPPPSKVEALDGSNYEEWSGRMRSAFKRYKLLKIAVGEEKMPEEGEAQVEAEVTIMRGMGALVAGGVPEWRAPAGTARRSGILGSSASAGRRDGHLQA
ncbi:hypothetical protein CLOP_g21807 [Closterium sp. NIES-67]|nr:hypothetical protein CLOP_g21807 [Closterium sp. NIES-67]